MAYVIFTANGDEIDRRDLTGAVTIGRAQDADIPVRDILLSRKHCRLEPSADHWTMTDLGSKNGTYFGNRQVTRHQLKDGDELRLGRTRMTFRAEAFEPAPAGTKRRDVVRPADPTEALAGTVAGFLLVEPGEVERQAGAPVPQPRPPEPTSYASEDVYGMLNEIASSSWDSIMAQASRPVVMERPLPRPSGYRDAAPAARRTRVAFSLQAPEDDADSASSATESSPNITPHISVAHRPKKPRRSRWVPPSRWWTVPAKTQRRIALGFVSIVVTALLVGAWVVAVNQGPRSSAAGPVFDRRATESRVSAGFADITFPARTLPASAMGRSAVPPQPARSTPESIPQTVTASVESQRASAARHAAFRSAARVAAVHFLVAR